MPPLYPLQDFKALYKYCIIIIIIYGDKLFVAGINLTAHNHSTITNHLRDRYNKNLHNSLWPPCVADANIIFLSYFFFFFLFLFFSRLISAVADWMSSTLPHMMWSQYKFRMQV